MQRRGARHRRRRHRAHQGEQDRPARGRSHALHRPGKRWPRSSAILAKAGHTTRAVVRRVLRGGHGSAAQLAAASTGEVVSERLRAVGVTVRLGGHFLRVGSARELAVAGANVAEVQQAGGWRSPATPEVYIHRRARAGRARPLPGGGGAGAASLLPCGAQST